MFLHSSEVLFAAIVKIQRHEEETRCRKQVLAYLDQNSDIMLHLEELQELFDHVKQHMQSKADNTLQEATYMKMIQEAGGESMEQKVLTLEGFERCLTDYQEQGWIPSSFVLHNSLLETGKITTGVIELETKELLESERHNNAHDAVMGWIGDNQDNRLGRDEIDKLRRRVTQDHLTDEDWRRMCQAGDADPKVGFTAKEFEHLKHTTFTFCHTWLPSSSNLYGVIKELHCELALEPDMKDIKAKHHEDYLQDMMQQDHGDALSKQNIDQVFVRLNRRVLTELQFNDYSDKVDADAHMDVWFYFDGGNDEGEYMYQLLIEWAPFTATDSERLEEAIRHSLITSSNHPDLFSGDLNIMCEAQHEVDLSVWDVQGRVRAFQTNSRGDKTMVQQGAGLSSKELIELSRIDLDFPSPHEISTALNDLAERHGLREDELDEEDFAVRTSIMSPQKGDVRYAAGSPKAKKSRFGVSNDRAVAGDDVSSRRGIPGSRSETDNALWKSSQQSFESE